LPSPGNLSSLCGGWLRGRKPWSSLTAESGLDNFGARYYQSQSGRWLLPDWSAVPVPVPYAVFSNPQSLNLYTYVGNNPVNAMDADGHQATGGNTSTGNNPYYMLGSAECGPNPGMSETNPLPSGPCAIVDSGKTLPATTSLSDLVSLQEKTQEQNITGEIRNTPTYQALVPLSSTLQYTVKSDDVHAVFAPETATHLNAAFRELNKDGIVPEITSGFRTFGEQASMRHGGSGKNPAAFWSWQEAGGAVDIHNPGDRQWQIIKSVMKKNGFDYGGRYGDPPHFDSRNFMKYQGARIIGALGYWAATQ